MNVLSDFSGAMPRVFLAVPFTPALKQRIVDYRRALEPAFANVHWIPPENYHLTVKFFGETKRDKLTERILPRLERVLQGRAAHELRFTGYGAFGGPRNLRVLHLHGESPELMALAEAVLAEFPDERPRPFRAHLTLGKPRRQLTREEQRANEDAMRRWQQDGPQALGLPAVDAAERIGRLVLMESVFTGRAVTYHDRVSFPLMDAPPE